MSRRLVHSSRQFVKDFVPPDYLLDGILQRRFIYSLTGRTGSGKSAITLLLSALIATNKSLNEHGLEYGRVLYFAGENPDDIRMRWIAMAQTMGFDVNDVPVHFVVGGGSIADVIDQITEEVETIDGVTLIVIDTSAAYFVGGDENSNVEAGQHARSLRALTKLAGGPCVIVNCHPVKQATDDNLLPRGGGAFIAEMDGNLTCVRHDAFVRMHWQGKFRGPEPPPIMFELITVTTPEIKDSKDRLIPTVMAKAIADSEYRERESSAHKDEDKVLAEMLAHEGASVADIGEAVFGSGAKKSTVWRILKRLEASKLVRIVRGRYELTEVGAKTAKKVGKVDGGNERIVSLDLRRSKAGTRNAKTSITTGRSKRND
jgi:hypothetical protein